MSNIFLENTQRFFNSDGTPLVGGKLYFYASKSSRLAPVYTTSAGTTEHDNPVILDSNGSCVVYLDSSTLYKAVLTDANDKLIYSDEGIFGAPSGTATFTNPLESDLYMFGSFLGSDAISFTPTTTLNIKNLNLTSDAAAGAYNFKNMSFGSTSSDSKSVTFTHVASAVNYIDVTNATTGNAPSVTCAGTDSNINLFLQCGPTSTVSVSGTTAYEDNISDDDDLINKKYMSDNSTVLGSPAVAGTNHAESTSYNDEDYVVLRVAYTAGVPAITKSHNVDSITDTGVGNCAVTVSATLKASHFTLSSWDDRSPAAISCVPASSNLVTGVFYRNLFGSDVAVKCYDLLGDTSNPALADPDKFFFISRITKVIT